MFERLKVLAAKGLLTQSMIDNAVAKGWITPEQSDRITVGTGIAP